MMNTVRIVKLFANVLQQTPHYSLLCSNSKIEPSNKAILFQVVEKSLDPFVNYE